MQQIEKVEQLANAGKLARLLHNPFRYVGTQWFNKFIYPRSKKGKLKYADTFFGSRMQVLLPSATDIYLAGGKTHSSEIRLAKYMINQLKYGDTVIDVGAHYGYYTLLAAKLVGEEGNVYAFDAAKNTNVILRQNVLSVPQVKTWHNAVSDKKEQVRFYEFPVLYSEYNTMNVSQFEQQNWIKDNRPEETVVDALTLDGFVQLVNHIPAFIKIDAEGAEDKVIGGAIDLLKNHAPVVVLEVLSETRDNAPHMKALAIMRSLGYEMFVINKEGILEAEQDAAGYLQKINIDSDNFVFIKNNK